MGLGGSHAELPEAVGTGSKPGGGRCSWRPRASVPSTSQVLDPQQAKPRAETQRQEPPQGANS